MAPKATETNRKLVGLPVSIVGPVDIGRLIRELAAIDDALIQLGLRQKGAEIKMPKTTQNMDQMLELNKLNLLLPADRKLLEQFLNSVRAKAPVLHVSFSADPAPAFTEKLLTWMRREIHPLLLLTIGMQPNIGAGCVVRGVNKHFDFSLRKDFLKKRDLLLRQLSPEVAAAPIASPPAAVLPTAAVAQGVEA